MLAGLWQHRDLAEDVFTLQDLIEAHELLDVRAENELRHADYLERNRAK